MVIALDLGVYHIDEKTYKSDKKVSSFGFFVYICRPKNQRGEENR